MPRRILTSTLIERFKQRCDMVGDDSIDRSEWLSYASEVYGELCTEASLGAASRYFETSTTITADGSVSYDEPADHYATERIVEVLDDGRERPLRELQPHEEAAYRGRTGIAAGWLHVDDQLFLCPAPASGTFKWFYIGQPTDLSAYTDADIVDVISPAGESFLVWGVAILAKAKGGKDVQLALAEKERARTRLQFESASRNLTDPKTRGPIEVDDDDCYRLPTWERP